MQEGLLNTKLAMTTTTKMTATTITTRAGAVMLYCGTLGISGGRVLWKERVDGAH